MSDAKPLTKDEIEHLERLEREAPRGEWRLDRGEDEDGATIEPNVLYLGDLGDPDADPMEPAALLCIALRNAAPSLLASARAHASALARAEAAEHERDEARAERDEAARCARHNAEHLADFEAAAFHVQQAFFPTGTVPSYTKDQTDALDELRSTGDGVVSPAFGVGECKTRLSEALAAAASLRERVRALEEGLRECISLLGYVADGAPLDVPRARAAISSARALLAPTKETTPAEQEEPHR